MVTLVNRAKMTTATTGTGTIALGAAEAGYQTFADAGVADAAVVRYVIEDGDAWEIGTGTYTASGTTLSRTVSESSNSGSAIDLSGSAVVFVSAVAADFGGGALTSASTSGASQTIDFSAADIYTSAADAAVVTYTFSNPATVDKVDLVIDLQYLDAWNLADANMEAIVSSVDTTATGVFFKPDGTQMYVIGNASDRVYLFNFNTPWEISTAYYTYTSFSVLAQDGAATDLFFKPDGTKMYVIGAVNNLVYQYSLSTAWDISTASYDSVSFSVASQDTSPQSIFFKPDGTKMYMLGGTGKDVNQYSLSTAWDISTASFDSVNFSVSAQTVSPYGLFFKPDGTVMYVCGLAGSVVNQYSLSTAWDISTASYDSVQLTVAAATPQGLFIKDDGTKLYVVSSGPDVVTQYSMAAVSTLVFPAATEAPRLSLTPSSKTALTITTTDGGASYQITSATGGIA